MNNKHVNNKFNILPNASNNVITSSFKALKSDFVFNERQTNVNNKHVNNLFDILPKVSNHNFTLGLIALK